MLVKKIVSALALGLAALAAYAGSCADCRRTYDLHKADCRGDTTCETRAKEAYDRCLVGCS